MRTSSAGTTLSLSLLVFSVLGRVVLVRAESEHRTKAAAEKHLDLKCYKCDNIKGDKDCIKVNNATTDWEKCEKDHRICQVRTITMSSQENKTAAPKLWMVNRTCSKTCEPVCTTIGERTKLRACTTCCETNLCNSGNSAEQFFLHAALYFLILLCVAVQLEFFEDARHDYSQKY